MALQTSQLDDSPSLIISNILEAIGLGTTAVLSNAGGTTGISSDWPIYVANLPDAPDNILVLHDTANVIAGVDQINNAMSVRYGFQCMVRSSDYDVGWQKASRVSKSITENVKNTSVVIGSNTYSIAIITVSSGPMFIGNSTEDSKSYLFNVNGLLSVRQEV